MSLALRGLTPNKIVNDTNYKENTTHKMPIIASDAWALSELPNCDYVRYHKTHQQIVYTIIFCLPGSLWETWWNTHMCRHFPGVCGIVVVASDTAGGVWLYLFGGCVPRCKMLIVYGSSLYVVVRCASESAVWFYPSSPAAKSKSFYSLQTSSILYFLAGYECLSHRRTEGNG